MYFSERSWEQTSDGPVSRAMKEVFEVMPSSCCRFRSGLCRWAKWFHQIALQSGWWRLRKKTFPQACRQCAMEEIVEIVRLYTVCSARGPGRSANTGPCVGRWRSSGGLSIQTVATVPLPSLSPSPSPGVRELTMPAVGGFEVFEIVRSWLGGRLGTPSTPCRKNVILIVEFSNPQTAVVKFVSKERLFEWKVEQKTVFLRVWKSCGSRYFRITI